MRSRSYVIVTSSGHPLPGRRELRRATRGRRVRQPHRARGRHRLGTPGRVRRYPSRPRRPYAGGRHRCLASRPARRPSGLTARYGTLVVLLGTVGISGWFTASGAAALAQMALP